MTVIDLKTMREVSSPSASVVCLGNFDGIHIGHAALIRETVEKRKTLSSSQSPVACGACFFRKPPADFMPPRPLAQLTTLEQKLKLFFELGLEYAFVLDFPEVGTLSPERFVTDVLVGQIHCVHAVCGFNFRFGHRASGTAEKLTELMGGSASVVSPVKIQEKTVSSSAIRQMLSEGEIATASIFLGRPFCLESEVMHGKALGRTIGVPTVNQYFPGNLAVPKYGIYITKTEIDGIQYPSVTNVGIRPSVDDGDRANCETHILNFDNDIYGKLVKVYFLEHLRDEIAFESIDALQLQIQKDILATAEFYKEARG